MSILMSILSNDGYIILNKYVMKALGLHEAILLGELCSEYIYWLSLIHISEPTRH